MRGVVSGHWSTRSGIRDGQSALNQQCYCGLPKTSNITICACPVPALRLPLPLEQKVADAGLTLRINEAIARM
jgi:hypothetical protein